MIRSTRPTMVDVAAAADVSLKTVSRVINGVSSVDPVLADRVNDAIVQLGFRRNAMAANLRSGASDTIGLITADLANSFYTSIASAVSAVAVRQGYQVIMASTDERPEAERELSHDLCQRRVSGLILVPSAEDQSYLESEIRLGTPVVFVDRAPVGLEADAVLIDNHGGAEAALAELIAGGHERIALLFDDLDISTMQERLDGAIRAFDVALGTPDPELIITDLHTPDTAFDAVTALLASPNPPDALFCANNRITIGAVAAIIRAGTDTAVAGFDDFEASRLLQVPVRVVDYDLPLLGRLAAERLFARIAGDTSPPQTTRIPTSLVSRGAR